MLFYFVPSLIRNFLAQTDFSSFKFLVNLSLPVFLKCFLIFAWFDSHVSYILF